MRPSLRESQIFQVASGTSASNFSVSPAVTAPPSEESACLATLKKNFETTLLTFFRSGFTRSSPQSSSVGSAASSGGLGSGANSEGRSASVEDFSSIASARATVESCLGDDVSALKDCVAVLLHMVGEAVAVVPSDEKKFPRPPARAGGNYSDTVLSPGESAARKAKVSTWYHRGSVLSPSASSAFSIYRTPSVVETEQVVIGRDEDDNKTINDYVIIGQLGKGSYGKVKLAEKQSSGQLVAIKIIKMSVFGKKVRPQVWKKLQQEIQVMRSVAHENLVRLYEVMHNAETEKIYLVMQYVPRGTITKVMGDGTCDVVDPPQLKMYAKQLIRGLYALHRANIFHRDVKPDNVLLGDEGKIFLADFGVSVICSEDGVEGVEGTPAYMAPELCRAEKNVRGDLVDVWALGVTLYQLMYGRLPFNGDSFLQLSRRIVHEQPPFPDRTPRGADVPETFKNLLRGMLEKDAARRMTVKQIREAEWFKEGVDQGECSVLGGDLEQLVGNDNTSTTSPTSMESIIQCTVVETPTCRSLDAKRRRLLATAAISQVASISSVESAAFSKQMSSNASKKSFYRIM